MRSMSDQSRSPTSCTFTEVKIQPWPKGRKPPTAVSRAVGRMQIEVPGQGISACHL